MTDRELLERAARAAGIDMSWHGGEPRILEVNPGGLRAPGPYPWNPRDDDGDALRLAVALNMSIYDCEDIYPDGVMALGTHPTTFMAGVGQEPLPMPLSDESRRAAWRRAIVRAAAAMVPEVAASWICPKCKVDRFKAPCGDPHRPPCPMTATAT